MGTKRVQATMTRTVSTCDLCDREISSGTANRCEVCGREVGYCCGQLAVCYDSGIDNPLAYLDLTMRLCKECRDLTDGDSGPAFLDLVRGHVRTAEAMIRERMAAWQTAARKGGAA